MALLVDDAAVHEAVLASFRRWDSNQDGVIDKTDLHKVLVALGLRTSLAAQILDQADTNRDDAIDYSEFVSWIFSNVVPDAVRSALPLEVNSKLDAVTQQIALDRATQALLHADALLICSGAGLGVDGGLGTFRGRHAAQWPPLKAMDLDVSDLSQPFWLEVDPRLAWSYWHMRCQAYFQTSPHDGYLTLARWGRAMSHGFFSVTSNVDGHWLRTPGVDPACVYECHGAITHVQGLHRDKDKIDGVWPLDPAVVEALHVPDWDLVPGEAVEVLVHDAWVPACVGDDGCVLLHPESGDQVEDVRGVRRPGGLDLMRVTDKCVLPHIPGDSTKIARPNNIMFRDTNTNMSRIKGQQEHFDAWCHELPKDANLLIIEAGAGTSLPTMRLLGAHEMMKRFANATLLRLNLDEYDVSIDVADGAEDRAIGIGRRGALETIKELDNLICTVAPDRFGV